MTTNEPSREERWREESLLGHDEYLEDKEDLTEIRKEYLLKIANKFNHIPEPDRTVNIISGIAFMGGYLAACKARQAEIEKLKTEVEELKRSRK